jgi:hypothetical protein
VWLHPADLLVGEVVGTVNVPRGGLAAEGNPGSIRNSTEWVLLLLLMGVDCCLTISSQRRIIIIIKVIKVMATQEDTEGLSQQQQPRVQMAAGAP